jgi:hypothetical protein
MTTVIGAKEKTLDFGPVITMFADTMSIDAISDLPVELSSKKIYFSSNLNGIVAYTGVGWEDVSKSIAELNQSGQILGVFNRYAIMLYSRLLGIETNIKEDESTAALFFEAASEKKIYD